MSEKVEIHEIRFNKFKTELGMFHRIDIVIKKPIENVKYNTETYWSVAGYGLTNLVADMIDKLNELDLEVDVNE